MLGPLSSLACVTQTKDIEVCGNPLRVRLLSASETARAWEEKDHAMRYAMICCFALIDADGKSCYQPSQAQEIADTISMAVLAEIVDAVNELGKKQKP